jgi:hypothetical protein
MSFKTHTMFSLQCDICGAAQGEYDEIVAWTDETSAMDVAAESDWTLKDGKHYCSKHWICEVPECHVECGPLAGEQDYLCDDHWAKAQVDA